MNGRTEMPKIAIRVPQELLEALDAHIADMPENRMMRQVSRSDFVRLLIEKAVMETDNGDTN